MIVLDEKFVDARIPIRKPDTNKNDYGRVTALCGCRGYTGAAYFAAQAAVHTGSGIVTLMIPQSIYPILAIKLQEPVVRPVEEDAEGKVTEACLSALLNSSRDAILAGPGLGRSPAVRRLICGLVQKAQVPLVLDADGINALAGHILVLEKSKYPVILTPHEGEFCRLADIPAITDRLGQAAAFAKAHGCILVLKGHRTLIALPDGTVLQNTGGNPGMAKGGSGDVLAGMILSLLGQGLTPADAAACGVYLHSKAGDLAANEWGEYGMTPSDMLQKIPQVLRKYNSREW
jgi:hydroxyethylthiazole kinase-like uncharacterized protein yjeF